MDGLNTYQGFSSQGEEPQWPTSPQQFLPSDSDFMAARIHRLEAELQVERCLNRLSDRLMQTFLAATADHESPEAAQAEVELFQGIVNDLRTTLGASIVAIALPYTEPEAPEPPAGIPSSLISIFKIFAVSPYESQRQGTQANGMVLTTGQKIRFGLGEAIAIADLQELQSQPSPNAWPISTATDTLGWLVAVGPHVHMSESPDCYLWEGQLRTKLLQGVSHQCAIALQRLSQRQSQCPHCQKLEQRNRELERANQLKSEFLANTSHEIRTPLSSILGFTHLLREQGYNLNNLRHREYLNIILSSGQHLLALINDILDLSKIEANQLNLQWENAKVDEICHSVLLLVKEKASDKGLELRLDLDPNATTFVVDPLRLKQMLFNLLSNALKFTVKGTVGLQVRLVGVFVHFTVWDTGTGISKDQQNQLFRPYSQIANAVVSRSEGTGLGLALTQRLAELHGGWVEVESELHRGSRFTIVLPLTPKVAVQEAVVEVEASSRSPIEPPPPAHLSAEMAPVAPHSPPLPSVARTQKRKCNQANRLTSAAIPLRTPAPYCRVPVTTGASRRNKHQSTVAIAPPSAQQPGTPPGANRLKTTPVTARAYHILLVEDHAPNAKLMIAYLSKMGYEVTWAKDADEMWQALAVSQPALLLMDIHLPKTDGLTLTRQLRARPEYQHLPIIAQTAMAMSGDRAICIEAGATDYITKPIDLQALGQLVTQYSNGNGSASPA